MSGQERKPSFSNVDATGGSSPQPAAKPDFSNVQAKVTSSAPVAETPTQR